MNADSLTLKLKIRSVIWKENRIRITKEQTETKVMNKYRFASFRSFGLAVMFQGIVSLTAYAGIKHDYGTYPVPPAPALPAAGGIVIDPTFETRIMRLTDANDGPNCINAYSYWPTFNINSTRLMVHNGIAPLLYQFDPVQFKILSKAVWDTPTPIGGSIGWEDAIWSGSDPDVIYAHDNLGMHLWAYNVATKTYTQVFDLTDQYNRGDYLWQMSKAVTTDNVFAFTRRDARYNVVGYLVWRRDRNQVVYDVTTNQLDEVQVDKSGRYLVVKTGQQGAGAIEVQVVDLKTLTVENLTDNGPDYAPGHSDNGNRIVVGADNWRNQVTFRTLAHPHSLYTLISYESDWTQDYHISMLADNEKWVLLSSYSGETGTPDGPFHDEIYQVATDGSGSVRRLAHHFSIYGGDYYASPRADISRDGRLIAFTSNWGIEGGRKDVFILKIPKAPSS